MTTKGMQYFESYHEPLAREVLQQWMSGHPHMGVLALVAEPDREAVVPQLQSLCSGMNVPLRGAVFPALVSGSSFHGRGFVLVRFDVMLFAEIYEPLRPSHPLARETLDRLIRDLAAAPGRPRESSLFLIFDAMMVNIATVLDELYLAMADRVRYLGVNAGSETFRPMPCLFDNARQAQDGALAVLLPDHAGAVVEHGYAAPERMITATSTSGSRVITIDWRPAFEVYQQTVEAEYGVRIDRENFYQYGVHFPFGIVRANGEILVRIPVALEEDGSLFCVGEVPPNAILTLLRAPDVDSVHTVDKIDRGLRSLCGDLSGAKLLTFYCAGRKLHLGVRAEDELRELGRRFSGAEIAGALSLGEVGQSMQQGYPLFHNGALLCCQWGRR